MTKIVIGLMLALAGVPAAWGSISACASPQKIVAAVVGPGNGCTAVNDTFENFNASAATGNGDGSFPPVSSGTAANIEFTATGTPTAAVDFTTTGQSTGQAACTADSWCVLENGTTVETGSQTYTYDFQSAHVYALSLSGLSLSTDQVYSGDTVTVEEQFCLGSTTFNCATSANNYGYLKIVETSGDLTGTFTAVNTVCRPGASGCTTTNPASAAIGIAVQTEIGIETTVTIATSGTAGGGRIVFLDSFNENFNDAPEPSTFVLFGTALVAVGLLRFRAPDRRSWFRAALSKGIMKRVLCVLGGLIAAGVSTNATTTFSSTGAVDLISPPASTEPVSIESTSIWEDPLQSDASLLLFIFAESDLGIQENTLTVDTTTPRPYTPDTYTSDPSDSLQVAEELEFVTYFLHRDS